MKDEMFVFMRLLAAAIPAPGVTGFCVDFLDPPDSMRVIIRRGDYYVCRYISHCEIASAKMSLMKFADDTVYGMTGELERVVRKPVPVDQRFGLEPKGKA